MILSPLLDLTLTIGLKFNHWIGFKKKFFQFLLFNFLFHLFLHILAMIDEVERSLRRSFAFVVSYKSQSFWAHRWSSFLEKWIRPGFIFRITRLLLKSLLFGIRYSYFSYPEASPDGPPAQGKQSVWDRQSLFDLNCISKFYFQGS